MQNYITPSNIMFVLGIGGVVFAIYRYFKDPQTQDEKAAALLAQQVKFITEASEARFKTMQENFQQLLLQSNNHIHTVDTKVEALTTTVNDMGKEIVKLGTIIEERIPHRNNKNVV